jgi:hypothetical protein
MYVVCMYLYVVLNFAQSPALIPGTTVILTLKPHRLQWGRRGAEGDRSQGEKFDLSCQRDGRCGKGAAIGASFFPSPLFAILFFSFLYLPFFNWTLPVPQRQRLHEESLLHGLEHIPVLPEYDGSPTQYEVLSI